ncbi:MAG TPA: hypothetical protein VGM41_14700 [Chitinophagaceae bacterium]
MKKLLLVLVIGASFAACNNNAGDKPATTDSPAAAGVDTSAKMGADTTKKDTSAMAPKMADTSATKK